MKLEGKVALVTGSSKGIGKSIATRYAREGATVVIVSRNEQQCEAAAGEIRAAGGRAITRPCDIAAIPELQQLVDSVVSELGRIDILVNNAGVFETDLLVDLTERNWDHLWDINTKGPVFLMQIVARQMIKQGKGGKIINVSSQAGRRGEKLCLAYGATKAAMIHITHTAALELAEHGINVNGIAPGVIDTDMWIKVDEQFSTHQGKPIGEARRAAEQAVPLGRFGNPNDLDGTAVFLASDDSAYVTAQTINVDGGNRPS